MTAAPAPASGPRRPDVVLVIADQWRGQDQGWIGNADVQTPHLDQLVTTGVALSGCYANHPVCGPSRASLLTGLLPEDHLVVANDLPLAEDVATLGTALRAAGYRTGWVGKWHLEGLPRDAGIKPGRRGFDWFASTNCSHDYLDGHYYTGSEPQRVDFTGYEPEIQTELAIDFLTQAPPAVPSCVVVSYGPPHDPYPDVPAVYRDRYDADTLTVRANAVDDPDARERLAQYYAGITAIDDQIGRLVGELSACGRLDQTLLVVTADHGDMLGSHGRRAKQVPYAEATSVPQVWHWPAGLAPARLSTGVVGLVDLTPTVLDLLGLPPLPHVYGRSYAPALRGDGALRDRVLLGNAVSVDEGWRQGVGEWRGFVDQRLTYARHVDGTPWVLFDDHADPWQLTNLVDGPASADRLRAADRSLDEMLNEAADLDLPAEALLRRLGLVELWNAREHELNGAEARPLEMLA